MYEWVPIGNDPNTFKGTFDGDGYVVRGMYISGTNNTHQGLFGYSHGIIMKLGVEAFYVKGKHDIGGLAGRNDGTISSCYAIGKVVGIDQNIGGLVGYSSNENCLISNSYALVDVFVDGSTKNIGGLLGGDYCKIVNSYAAGTVSGSTVNIGGLIGDKHSSTVISYSYYDSDKNGTDDVDKGIPKTTLEMQTQTTYSGWDINGINWGMGGLTNDGMPYLLWQNTAELWDDIYVAPIAPPTEYTGSEITPKPVVTEISTNDILEEGIHFYYEYKNNINASSKASVSIVGMGSYDGYKSAKIFFTISKNSGAPTFSTPGAIDVVYSEGLTLNSVKLPSGYTWENQEEEIEDEQPQQSFFAYYTSSNYINNAIGEVTLNVTYGVDTSWYKGISSSSISNKAQLAGLAWLVNNGTSFSNKEVMLSADIELDDMDWTPIGTPAHPFQGKFDGDGHTISGMNINNTENYQGLFGVVAAGGQIINLDLSDFSVSGGKNVGGLAGAIMLGEINNAYIKNVRINGIVSGTKNIGGLVGSLNSINKKLTIENVWMYGEVEGIDSVGGFIGGIEGSTLLISNARGENKVTGQNNVGGFIGYAWESPITIENSYVNNTITGSSCVGGLAGSALQQSSDSNGKLHIRNSYSLATLTLNSTGPKGNLLGCSECIISLTSSAYTEFDLSYFYFNKNSTESCVGDYDFNYLCTNSLTEAEMKSKDFEKILNDAARADYTDFDAIPKKWVHNSGHIQLSTEDLAPLPMDYYFARGVGIDDDPYIITTKQHLKNFAKLANHTDLHDKYVALGADIKLNETSDWATWSDATTISQWTPIEGFEGSFDGAGHTISGMYISNKNNNQGLFGYDFTGTVKNLGLDLFYIKGDNNVGAIAGSIKSNANIINVWAYGKIIGTNNIGGLVGYISHDSQAQIIVNSYAAVQLTVGNTNISEGLIVNDFPSSVIVNSYYDKDFSSLDSDDEFGLPTSKMKSNDFVEELNFYASFLGNGTKKWVYNKGGYPKLSIEDFGDVDIGKYFAGGTGTCQDPYKIKDKYQLINFAKLMNMASSSQQPLDALQNFEKSCVVLGADIKLNETSDWANWDDTKSLSQWTPIDGFKGTFDGAGHTISGMYISNDKNNQGLFGDNFAGTVMNLGLDLFYVKGRDNVGAVAGYSMDKNTTNWENGIVLNVWAYGKVSGNQNVGGLVGLDENNGHLSINNSYAAVHLTGNSEIGGVLGKYSSAYIKNSYYDKFLNNYYVNDSSDVIGLSTTDIKSEKFVYEFNFFAVMDQDCVPMEWKHNQGSYPKFSGNELNIDNKWEYFCESGTGSQESPCILASKSQLINIALLANKEISISYRVISNGINIALSGDYITLGSDIDLENYSWTPIGNAKFPFTGIFNGAGHTISNMNISGESYQGLFGYFEGTIKNLGLENFEINGNNNLGGLVGYVPTGANASIINSYAIGEIKGNSNVGGLVGAKHFISELNIANSYSAATFTGTPANKGGLLGGGNQNANISHSYFDNGTNTTLMKSKDFVDSLILGAQTLKLAGAKTWISREDDYPTFDPSDSVPAFDIAEYLSGKGSVTDPYIILDKKNLEDFAWLVNTGLENFDGKHVVLGADIPLNNNVTDRCNTNWTPIGSYSAPFKGYFDGKRQKISGICINDFNSRQGFFGFIEDATIKDLGLEDFYIKGNDYIGAIVGQSEGSVISACYAETGAVSGNNYVGGLAGSISNLGLSYVKNITVTGTKENDCAIGGLIGSGNISNSYAIVDVINANGCGGALIGSEGSLTNSYASGNEIPSHSSGFAAGTSVSRQNSFCSISTSSSCNDDLTEQTAFTDWDFDNIWDIGSANGGMPYLRWNEFPKIAIIVYDYEHDLTLAQIALAQTKGIPFYDNNCSWIYPETKIPKADITYTYYASCKPLGYALSTSGTIDVKINKNPGQPTNLPIVSQIDIVYFPGLTLEHIKDKIPDGCSWTDYLNTPLYAGERTFDLKYKDAINYVNSATLPITVNVANATGKPIFDTTLAYDTIYSQNLTLSSFNLPKGYEWIDDLSTKVNAGTNSFAATLTDANYTIQTAEGTITLKVSQGSGEEPEFQQKTIEIAYRDGLKLKDVKPMPEGYSWVTPDTLIYPNSEPQAFDAEYQKNFLVPIKGVIILNVLKDTISTPSFPSISLHVSYSANLTLESIKDLLPASYSWKDPLSTPVLQTAQFAATYEHPYYKKHVDSYIAVNVYSGQGTLTIADWVYGETPSLPVYNTTTNDKEHASLHYSGKTNGGVLYGSENQPTEAGEYTLTVEFAAKLPYPRLVLSTPFVIKRAQGEGTVSIEGWRSGSTPSKPIVASETNGTTNVEYSYKSYKGTSYGPTNSRPSGVGNYTLIATFKQSNNYNAVKDSTRFTISSSNAKELTVVWRAGDVFEFNKMVHNMDPYVEDEDGKPIALTLLNARSEAGKYDGVLSARAMIENEAVAQNYILKNNTKSFEITKKPLKAGFKVNAIDKKDTLDSDNDTVWVSHFVFADTAALRKLLLSILNYDGFATDTTKKETDDESVLSGKPKIDLNYDTGKGAARSMLAKRVETTQKATATIITDDVSAKNYTLSRSTVVVKEAITEEEGAEQIFCERGPSCAQMSKTSCDLIKGEVVPSCTKFCIVDDGIGGKVCAPMATASCTAFGGQTVSDCGSTPLVKNFSFAGKFRIWQTASGVLNIDIGYMPPAPVTLQIYNLKGSLIATEQIKTRYANIKFHAPTGKYVFKAGKIVTVHTVY
ncbi:MAG: hypothetical protein FWC26_07545 [Fibromonadales bacterium]|nr:hypothetical protein [Fibromonadales bacterium]